MNALAAWLRRLIRGEEEVPAPGRDLDSSASTTPFPVIQHGRDLIYNDDGSPAQDYNFLTYDFGNGWGARRFTAGATCRPR